MFILDSLMISGIRWALETALTAAEAEMNDDSVLREQLLEAEMRREMGEISDDDFRAFEADLLARIREIKERREGGAGPLAFGPQPIEAGDGTFQVEASVFGDFHDPATAPHTTVLAPLDEHHALASLVSTTGEETIEVLDMEPGDAAEPQPRGSAARTPSRTRKGIASAAPGPLHARKRDAPAQPVAVGGVRRGPGAPAQPAPASRVPQRPSGTSAQPARSGRAARSGSGTSARRRTSPSTRRKPL